MKKGFTLIELLAVIVILAIIAVIAVPIVIDIIEDTKINSLKSSANMYLKTAELYISNAELNKIKINSGTYQIMEDGDICIGTYSNKVCNGEIIKMEVKGTKPNRGKIIINKNNIQIDYLEIDGYNCFENKKNFNCKKAGNANLETTGGLITIQESKSASLSNYRIYGNSVLDDLDIINIKLPDEYQSVEYIESTGTQYIDTGFTPNQNTRVVVDYQQIEIISTFIFGSRTSAVKDSFSVSISPDGTSLFTAYGTSGNFKYANSDTNRHKIDKNKNLLYVDDKLLKTFGEQTFTSPGTLEIFAIYDSTNGEGYLPSIARIYYFKIYDNDKLVRAYIPCYRKLDGEVGLFDLIENKFYENRGTGSFKKGKDGITNEIFTKSVGDYNNKTEKYEIPIRVTGKNLMKSVKGIQHTAFGVAISSNKGESTFSINGNCNKSGQLNVIEGSKLLPGEYKVKIEGTQNLNNYFFHAVDENNNIVKSYNIGYKVNTIYNFTLENESNIRFAVSLINETSYNDEYKIIVQPVNSSKDVTYEPYKEENYKIELEEPLRCIGKICDYIDYIKEKVVRNVGFDNGGNLIELEENYLEDIELPDIKINKGVSNILIETKIKPSKSVIEYNN